MTKSFSLSPSRGVLALVTAAALVAAGALFATFSAKAHDDPTGCTSTGVGISLTVYRADGTTPVGSGTIQSGETVNYETTLSHLGGSNCNFEGGTLTITTPDGVVHDVTPVGGIPLVSSGDPFVSAQVPYVAAEADVGGDNDFDASTDYTDGTAHLGTDDQTVSASSTISTEYEDVALEVSKTAEPSLTETFEWTIDKSVTPETWSLFNGDTGTSEYTVALTKTGPTTSGHSVTGTITVFNPATFADAIIESVEDVLTGGIVAAVDCGVTFPFALGPGETLECTYSADLPDDTTRTNTATAETSGDVDGDSGEATVDFTDATVTTENDTVTVEDTNGELWVFTDSGEETYTRTFDCSAVEFVDGHGAFDHVNTATIVETEQSDNAVVTVDCYELAVEKTAETEFTRQWEWMIDKTGDQTELTLAAGEQFTVNYEVTVDTVGFTDSGWMVSGSIVITNPNPDRDAQLTDVSDLVSPDIAAAVDCPALVVPAGGTLECTYSTDLPDGTNRVNTATATLQNHDFDAAGVPTPSGTTDATGSADVVFGEPTEVIDETVEVTDTFAGVLGTATAGVDTPKVFNYERVVGPFADEECGEHLVDNTATFITNDTLAQGSDDHSVLVTVPCELGCTLTQGYWKTHNATFHGGAPVDDNWENLGPDAENTEFFLSGQTWFEVFWTAPKGNAYYNLAHQYMAAVLNSLNGASVPDEVQDAIDEATALFTEFTPEEVGAWKGKQGERKTFLELAEVLGDYNEGLIGPGHCDEEVVLE